MATFLSRTASYAALQRSKRNPGLRTKLSLEFLPTELRICSKKILFWNSTQIPSPQVTCQNQAVKKDIKLTTIKIFYLLGNKNKGKKKEKEYLDKNTEYNYVSE